MSDILLGFAKGDTAIKHNFQQVDALKYAKEGTLEQK
jgi:hypothetical protein